jgi:hypothetical protein
MWQGFRPLRRLTESRDHTFAISLWTILTHLPFASICSRCDESKSRCRRSRACRAHVGRARCDRRTTRDDSFSRFFRCRFKLLTRADGIWLASSPPGAMDGDPFALRSESCAAKPSGKKQAYFVAGGAGGLCALAIIPSSWTTRSALETSPRPPNAPSNVAMTLPVLVPIAIPGAAPLS